MSAGTRDGLLRARYVLLAAWVLFLMVAVMHRKGGSGGDWFFFTEGFALLVHGHANVAHRFTTIHFSGGGLQLYARHPEIQIGPLALLVAGLAAELDRVNRYLAPTITALVGVATVYGLERTAVRMSPGRVREIQKLALVGGVLVLYTWVQAFVDWRHLDDMLVVIGTAVAVAAIANRKPWLLGAAVGLSVAAKPTALVLLPLLFALSWRENRKAVLVGAALIGACWLPFVIADPATLHAGVPQVTVTSGSGLTVLGFAVGTVPKGIRAVQLAVALLGGVLAVRRRRWWLVPLIGFALRTALDPDVASYYAVSIVFAALAVDLLPSPRAPITTLVTWLAFSEPLGLPTFFWPAPSTTIQAWLRLAVPFVLATVLLLRPNRASTEVAGVVMAPRERESVDAISG